MIVHRRFVFHIWTLYWTSAICTSCSTPTHSRDGRRKRRRFHYSPNSLPRAHRTSNTGPLPAPVCMRGECGNSLEPRAHWRTNFMTWGIDWGGGTSRASVKVVFVNDSWSGGSLFYVVVLGLCRSIAAHERVCPGSIISWLVEVISACFCPVCFVGITWFCCFPSFGHSV